MVVLAVAVNKVNMYLIEMVNGSTVCGGRVNILPKVWWLGVDSLFEPKRAIWSLRFALESHGISVEMKSIEVEQESENLSYESSCNNDHGYVAKKSFGVQNAAIEMVVQHFVSAVIVNWRERVEITGGILVEAVMIDVKRGILVLEDVKTR